MKKHLIALLIAFLALPSIASATLWSFYAEKNLVLPPISERIVLAEQCGIFDYYGSYTQNLALEKCLLSGGTSLGAQIPTVVALFETSLQNTISSSATTMTLVSATMKNGSTLNGYYNFIIDEGNSNEEFVLATCVSTACTGLSRGIDPVDGKTEVAALKFSHRKGASVKITNYPELAILARIINGQETFPNAVSFDYYPTVSSTLGYATTSWQLLSLDQVNSIARQGAGTSTDTVAGISRLATQIEMASTTWTALDPTVIQTRYSTSSPSANRGIYSVVSENDGYIDSDWIRHSDNQTWTGNHTFDKTMYGGTASTTDVTGTVNIDWSAGNTQMLMPYTTTTVTFSNVKVGTALRIFVCQYDHGNKTIGTWPAGMRWATGYAPTLSVGANKCDVVTLMTATSTTSIFGAITNNF